MCRFLDAGGVSLFGATWSVSNAPGQVLRTMRLEELAAILGTGYVKTSLCICRPDEGFLGAMAGHGDTSGPAVLVDARLADDALNAVSVAQSLTERLEDDRADSFLHVGVSINMHC